MSKRSLLLKYFFSFLLFLLPMQLWADGLWQFYRINAQYRGAAKKSFSNIGCALAWFNDMGPGKTQVITHVCAINPDKENEVFGFRANLLLGFNADSTWVINTLYSEFSGIHGNRQKEVQQLICLWDLIRRRTYYKTPIGNLLNLAGQVMSLKERKARNGLEINCSPANRRGFSGKYFLQPGDNKPWEIDKFRFRSGKVSVSLVKDTNQAISREFRFKEPFASMVFDNK
jgi:hypothetical protein